MHKERCSSVYQVRSTLASFKINVRAWCTRCANANVHLSWKKRNMIGLNHRWPGQPVGLKNSLRDGSKIAYFRTAYLYRKTPSFFAAFLWSVQSTRFLLVGSDQVRNVRNLKKISKSVKNIIVCFRLLFRPNTANPSCYYVIEKVVTTANTSTDCVSYIDNSPVGLAQNLCLT